MFDKFNPGKGFQEDELALWIDFQPHKVSSLIKIFICK